MISFFIPQCIMSILIPQMISTSIYPQLQQLLIIEQQQQQRHQEPVPVTPVRTELAAMMMLTQTSSNVTVIYQRMMIGSLGLQAQLVKIVSVLYVCPD